MTGETAPLWRVRAHETLARALEGPMLLLSIGFLVVLIWPLADPHMAAGTRTALDDADWGIWAAFAVEYVVLLVTAPHRPTYVRSHLLDLAIVVLPMLRPLRVVRSVRLLRLLRLARLAAIAAQSIRRSRTAFFSRAVVFALTLGALVTLSAAAAVLDLERQARGANIHSFGDALWWAVTTSTTVGYGDRYPVSSGGRAIAAVLMLLGLAIVGVVTAAIAAWLVSLTQEQAADAEHRQAVDLHALAAQLAALQASVEALHRRLDANQPPAAAPEG